MSLPEKKIYLLPYEYLEGARTCLSNALTGARTCLSNALTGARTCLSNALTG